MRIWGLFATLLVFLCAPVKAARMDAAAVAGKTLFQQKCVACHSVGGGDRIGPDLLGVTKLREYGWLARWIMHPDQMREKNDPIAFALLTEFKQVPMPNLEISEGQAKDLIAYLGLATEAPATKTMASESVPAPGSLHSGWVGSIQFNVLVVFLLCAVVIAIVFWHVVASTHDPIPTIDMKSAYAIRKKLFIAVAVVGGCTLAATLPFTPYRHSFETPDQLVYVAARQFSFSYSSEPITNDEELGRVKLIDSLRIPKGSLVEFRVTSLDATHGFAIYNPDGSVLTQTQAMPGYTNRLRVRFPNPGSYNVLCLEYCGAAHHLMRSAFIVE